MKLGKEAMSNYAGIFNANDINNPWNKAFDMVQDNSYVLDVGCSTGNFGRALIDYKGCKVDGIEPDREDANLASQKLNRVFHGYLEEALKKKFTKKYDYIVFLDVIEHLYDPTKTLTILKDFLKPEGRVVFSIPNMAHVSTRIMLLGGDFEYGNTGLLDNTHLHFYTNTEIERVFNQAGYVVDSWDYTEASYNDEILKRELVKIGITEPNKSILAKLKEHDAQIFQYIGSAKIGNSPSSERKHYSPDPQTPIRSWYDEQVAYLSETNRNQEQQINVLNRKISELEDSMSNIEGLPGHISLGTRVRRVLIRILKTRNGRDGD